MVYHLKRISVWPVVKIAFIIYGLIGLCFGGLYGLGLLLIGGLLNMVGGESPSPGMGTFAGAAGFAVAMLFAMMSAVFGAAVAAFATWLYNVLASLVGGVELFLEAETMLEHSRPLEVPSVSMAEIPPVDASPVPPEGQS